MPDQDDNWFEELATPEPSTNPLINAVKGAASKMQPMPDDLALARLKKRLRAEGLIETRTQRFIRRYSPPIASAAVVLLCFSVLLQSGVDSVASFKQPDDYAFADYPEPPVAAMRQELSTVEASVPPMVVSDSEQVRPSSAAPMPSAPAVDALLSRQRAQVDSRQQKQYRAEAQEQMETAQRLESLKRLESDQRERSWASGADSTVVEPEGFHATYPATPAPKTARLIIELPTDAELSVFDEFRNESTSTDELLLHCLSAESCRRLNVLIIRQAGWPHNVQFARPDLMLVVRRLK